MIEFTSLKRQFDCYATEYEKALLRAARSGWYILGGELQAFEAQFAAEFVRGGQRIVESAVGGGHEFGGLAGCHNVRLLEVFVR